MSLDQFQQPDGWYKFDGCDFETAEDVLQCGILGFCGCGSPDENLEYIRGGLEVIANLQDRVWKKEMTYEEWETARDTHFGNNRAAYFFYYWAAKNDVTEHGGSVPGWLSDKGRNLLKLLNENKATSQSRNVVTR